MELIYEKELNESLCPKHKICKKETVFVLFFSAGFHKLMKTALLVDAKIDVELVLVQV